MLLVQSGFSHDHDPVDGNLARFYSHQTAVRGYNSDEQEETNDSDFEILSACEAESRMVIVTLMLKNG